MIQADTSKPLITVVGASSKQGRSVAEALLDSGRYRVRALTRRRDSQPAQILAQKGAEVVVAPLEPGKQAELTAAMSGSAGAFLMTPPIVKVPPAELEFTLGKELADAAVAAGVGHVVFSGLENVEARTGGTKWAPHFTDKAKVADHIRSLPIRSSFVYLAFFYTNFLEYYVPQRGKDGITFAIYLPPHIPMPFCDPLTSAGPAVREIFDDGDTLPATWAEWLKMAEEMKKGLEAYGHPVMKVRIDPTAFPAWCAAHGTTPDRQGRKAFVAEAAKERYGDQK